MRHMNLANLRKKGGLGQTVGLALTVYVVIKAASLTGLINDYWQIMVDQSLTIAIGALGLNVIYGFAGQFSLGHAAFYGIGAYTAGVIGKELGRGNPLWFVVALIAGMVVPALVSLVIEIGRAHV